MYRDIHDLGLTTTVALPAAGATATTDSFDIKGSGSAYPDVELLVTLPDTPDLVDDKTITVKIEQSDDDSSFEDASKTITLTGASGSGAAGTTLRYKPNSGDLQYFRASATVEAAGGDNTDVDVTFEVVS